MSRIRNFHQNVNLTGIYLIFIDKSACLQKKPVDCSKVSVKFTEISCCHYFNYGLSECNSFFLHVYTFYERKKVWVTIMICMINVKFIGVDFLESNHLLGQMKNKSKIFRINTFGSNKSFLNKLVTSIRHLSINAHQIKKF